MEGARGGGRQVGVLGQSVDETTYGSCLAIEGTDIAAVFALSDILTPLPLGGYRPPHPTVDR